MLERALKKNEMHFHFSTFIDNDGPRESIEYFTNKPNHYSRGVGEFASMLVDLADEHGSSVAYHIPTGSRGSQIIPSSTPSVSVSEGYINVRGASSPADYVHVIAGAIKKEIIKRANSR